MPEDDVNLKGIAAFFGILALILALVWGIMLLMWRGLERGAQRADEPILRQLPPPAVIAARSYFPAPREQPDPKIDLDALRAREETELNSYGWIDRTSGVVRIPIDRAIEVLTQHPEEHR